MTRIAAVILAAGLSSRLPGNKLLQPLRGKPVIRHVAEAVLASQASPVIVVTGNDGDKVRGALTALPVEFANNPDYATGLSSSLKCGVKHVPAHCDGVVVALGDMPFVTSATFDCLIKAFDPDSGRAICVPMHHGQPGNPVLWGRAFFTEIGALTGDKGAKALMALHRNLLVELEVPDDGVLVDIDTPEDLQRQP